MTRRRAPSRREFLQLAGWGAGALALAACGQTVSGAPTNANDDSNLKNTKKETDKNSLQKSKANSKDKKKVKDKDEQKPEPPPK